MAEAAAPGEAGARDGTGAELVDQLLNALHQGLQEQGSRPSALATVSRHRGQRAGAS
jgi:hypothetical protein